MPTASLIIKFSTGGIVPAVSIDDVKSSYLFGIPLKSFTGETLKDSEIENAIKATQQEIENYLDIKIHKQIITEQLDFSGNDWRAWGYVRTTYPVSKAFRLDGWVGQVKQISYPKGWLVCKHSNQDSLRFRSISIVPNGNSDGLNADNIVYSGVIPVVGLQGASRIPSYWQAEYCTGFEPNQIPLDILDVIKQGSAMKILGIVGNVLYGPGIASKSLSVDGLSQNVGFTAGSGGGVFGQMIKDYQSQYPAKMLQLRRYYRGIGMETA